MRGFRLAAWLVLSIVAIVAAATVMGARDDRTNAPLTASGIWSALVEAVAADDDNDDDDDDDGRFEARDDDDDDAPPLPLVGGAPAVRLDGERERLAGLATARLEPASLTPGMLVTADIVDIQPLVALRDRYRERFFGAQAADVALTAAKREYDRLSALYREDADVAQKAVLQAEAVWRMAEAERYGVWAGLDSLRTQARREWGAVLAEWAFTEDDSRFARLIAGRDNVARALLPAGRVLPEGVDHAFLTRNGTSVPVSYLSPAPHTAAGAGESHFFLTPGLSLPAALRLPLWIPLSGEPITGLSLPQEAVVRALGRDWAYVRVDASHFARREVSLDHMLEDGGYLVDDLDPGDEVAVSGAVVLYAEEFRSQIRDEDDDD